MHGLQACLFKYITVTSLRIYLSVVKMPLKREVGGHALKVMEITLLIMENHGKIIELCFSIFCGNPGLKNTNFYFIVCWDFFFFFFFFFF